MQRGTSAGIHSPAQWQSKGGILTVSPAFPPSGTPEIFVRHTCWSKWRRLHVSRDDWCRGSSCSQGSGHTASIQPTQDRGDWYGSTPVEISQPSFGKLWKTVASLKPRKIKAASHLFGPRVPVWNLWYFKEMYSFLYIIKHILCWITSSCRTLKIQNQKPTLPH